MISVQRGMVEGDCADVMAVSFFFHSLYKSKYSMNFNAGLYFPEICLRRSLLNVLMHLSMCMFVCMRVYFFCVKGL